MTDCDASILGRSETDQGRTLTVRIKADPSAPAGTPGRNGLTRDVPFPGTFEEAVCRAQAWCREGFWTNWADDVVLVFGPDRVGEVTIH